MDDIDRHLLALLREDASRPLKTLAAAVSRSRSSVRERVARLESSGAILRYTIETSPDHPGLGAICLLRLARTPDLDVVAKVVAIPHVVRCQALAGDIDLMLELFCPDPSVLNTTRDRIAALAGVEEVTTHLILSTYKPAA